ncbi:uncharacterized protein tbc1d10aa isoform X2 [Misgurnus anguillicaudatus]|uniref:uncharacterized protein tbc1d10aa isoform X2 n=1 Tax=Misgurnus anguillicaudatus TaxID=75329 RepID=UPI003CCF418D
MGVSHLQVRLRCQKGIPPSLRGRAWLYLSGGKVKREQNIGKFKELDDMAGDPKWVDVIERDLHRQFPFHEMFVSRGGHGQQDLFRVLKAYTLYRPEEGYCQAQAPIAAVLLMHMPAEDAFWGLVQICEKYLPGYYSTGLEAIQLDGEILNALLKRVSPVAYRHLDKHKIEPILYMTEWFMCAFSRTLPWASVLRVWDMFLCDGVKIIFRVGLVLLKCMVGSREKLKACAGQYETMELLRALDPRYMQEGYLVQQVLELPISARDVEREHRIQLKRWRKTHGELSYKSAPRLHGAYAIMAAEPHTRQDLRQNPTIIVQNPLDSDPEFSRKKRGTIRKAPIPHVDVPNPYALPTDLKPAPINIEPEKQDHLKQAPSNNLHNMQPSPSQQRSLLTTQEKTPENQDHLNQTPPFNKIPNMQPSPSQQRSLLTTEEKTPENQDCLKQTPPFNKIPNMQPSPSQQRFLLTTQEKTPEKEDHLKQTPPSNNIPNMQPSPSQQRFLLTTQEKTPEKQDHLKQTPPFNKIPNMQPSPSQQRSLITTQEKTPENQDHLKQPPSNNLPNIQLSPSQQRFVLTTQEKTPEKQDHLMQTPPLNNLPNIQLSPSQQRSLLTTQEKTPEKQVDLKQPPSNNLPNIQLSPSQQRFVLTTQEKTPEKQDHLMQTPPLNNLPNIQLSPSQQRSLLTTQEKTPENQDHLKQPPSNNLHNKQLSPSLQRFLLTTPERMLAEKIVPPPAPTVPPPIPTTYPFQPPKHQSPPSVFRTPPPPLSPKPSPDPKSTNPAEILQRFNQGLAAELPPPPPKDSTPATNTNNSAHPINSTLILPNNTPVNGKSIPVAPRVLGLSLSCESVGSEDTYL